ncbi:thiamine pyrophosphate-binding protein [Arthrobacter sp. USHLN218]|uniref:thiamine pyrophosphate-binding protein n=1 Tax=Arthrobacter sp. USHLN218 TaxID=3081232 RepID=UPI00301631CE
MTHPVPTQPRTGGEVLVSALAEHGVDTVFGIPGTHNLPIFAAMPGNGIRNITTRHEQGAGYAADGYARSTGKVGVVVTTTGPAALNAATALGQAYSDSVPILVIAPGMPTGHPSHGNGLLHEFRDQRGAMAGVVQESHRVESVAEIPAAVAQAFARLNRGRRRAEYLEVPLDLLDETAVVENIVPLATGTYEVAPEAEVNRAAAALAQAGNVVVLAGGGASNASTQVQRVAERLGAPVITTTNGKGVLREDHPLALGSGMQLSEFVELIEGADAVLAVGTEFASADWFGGMPKLPKTLIRIDVDPAGLFANANPSHPLVGDSRETLRQLDIALESLSVRADESAAGRVASLKERIIEAQQRSAKTWLASLASLDEVLPENTVIAADNAMVAYNGALAVLRPKRSRSFLFPTGAGTLGYGLPAGIGAKIAAPETTVVVLQGDGGMMFSATELATAAQYGVALPVLVYDNGGYGEIHNEMVDRNDPVHSVALNSPDFPALARSLGCLGVELEDPADLGALVKDALAADRPTLIHIREESRASQGLRP